MKQKNLVFPILIASAILIIVLCVFFFSPHRPSPSLSVSESTTIATDSPVMEEAQTEAQESTQAKYCPSKTIIKADYKSGSFQLGSFLFTMPTRLSALTGNGVEVVQIDDVDIDNRVDNYIDPTVSHTVLLYYDGIYFTGRVFDRNYESKDEISIHNSVLTCVEENLSNEYCKTNIDHIYFPGGIHIGTYLDDAISCYGNYDSHKAAAPPILYQEFFNYGTVGRYSIDDSCSATFSSNIKTNYIESVALSKNIVE